MLQYRIAVPETILVENVDITSVAAANANIEKEELFQIVHDALKNNSTLTKNTFWMRVENISAQTTANELNTTTQTIHNTFSRSLATVREYIKKHYPEFVVNKLKFLAVISLYFLR